MQADAGSFHVEVVPNGTTLQVFLRDHSDKDVATAGFKGTAIFVIDGKPQRIPLTPAGDEQADRHVAGRAAQGAEGRGADHDADRQHGAGEISVNR